MILGGRSMESPQIVAAALNLLWFLPADAAKTAVAAFVSGRLRRHI
jgi:biotin transporter BioY